MRVLIRLLFESWWLLAAVWVAVQFILIALWSWRRNRLWARTVWVGFIALPLLLGTSALVVTDAERIIEACEYLAARVEAGDVSAIEHMLAEDFEAEGLDRDAITNRLERGLTRYRIWDVSLGRFEVTFPRWHEGVAEFHATARVRSAELVHDRLASKWRLTFRKRSDAWQLVGIESLPTPPLNLDRLRSWLR